MRIEKTAALAPMASVADRAYRLMAKEYGAILVTAEEIAMDADFVVLGVKPQALQDAISPIATFLQERTDVTIVTMAAGISIATIQGFIQKAPKDLVEKEKIKLEKYIELKNKIKENLNNYLS